MTGSPPALRLHIGRTVHHRFVPFKSSFKYRMAMIDIDIDRLSEASRTCALFAVEKAALFSFRRRDHGALKPVSLRPWAEAEFQKAGIDASGASIRLITVPRHAFYKFSPISLWIAQDEDGAPTGILYEVRNTFGEKHTYISRLTGSWSRHSAPKSFYVSPFFDVSGQYEFSLQLNHDELRLGVTTVKDGVPVHSATLITHIRPATSGHFLKLAFAMPLSTIGVTLGIHWEALKLWLKGAKYASHPAEKTKSTLASSAGTDK